MYLFLNETDTNFDSGVLSAPNYKNAQVLTIDGMGVSAVLLSRISVQL